MVVTWSLCPRIKPCSTGGCGAAAAIIVVMVVVILVATAVNVVMMGVTIVVEE